MSVLFMKQQLIITFYFEEVRDFLCSQININIKTHPILLLSGH